MRKKKFTKMTALLLVTALSAATVFSGCNKKVDYDVDGDGNSENSGSGDSGALASRLGIPESYEGDIEVGDSGLKSIKIKDDDISVPASDSMSIINYKSNTFDNAYKQKVCEAVFDKSKGIYVYDWEHQTKSDLQSQIDSFQAMIEEAKASGDTETESYCNEYISYLEDEMTNATDERTGAGDYSATDFIGNIGDNEYMLSFSDSEEGLGANFELSYYPSEGLINYKPHEGATYVYAYDAQYGDEDVDESMPNSCTFTQDEAVSLAQEFLNSCGIDDVIPTYTSQLLWEYYDTSYDVVATEYDGYIMTFGRSVNGTAPYSADLSMVDSLSSDDDVWYDSTSETFTIQVDSNGVINASCYPLLAPTGDEQKNVELMSWKDLLSALNKNVPAYYTENKTSYNDIEYNDVRLTYYCMKDESQENIYQYVPVWIFAQADEEDGNYDFDYPVQAIMVNAVDGTIYDLKEVLQSTDASAYYDDTMDSTYTIDGEEDGSDEYDDDTIIGGDDGSDDTDIDSSDVDNEKDSSDIDTLESSDDAIVDVE